MRLGRRRAMTPTARPRSTITSRTPASVSISTPCARAALGHRLGDRAHAADGVAPDALLAVHLAEGVVQHHVGRARRVGAGVVADDGVEAEQRLDQIALEPLVEHLAGRAREQVEQVALLLQRQPRSDAGGAERVAGLRAAPLTPNPCDEVRRRAQHELAQHVGDALRARAMKSSRPSASRALSLATDGSVRPSPVRR